MFDSRAPSTIRDARNYLWDAWSYKDANHYHLYCLSVPRFVDDGTPLKAADRNQQHFCVRYYYADVPKTWGADLQWSAGGCFQQVGRANDAHDAGNIWSGSVLPLEHGDTLVAYTGLWHPCTHPQRFAQNIGVGIAKTASSIETHSQHLLCCPMREYERVVAAGYYVDPPKDFGGADGERGGAISAWRDPFLLHDTDGRLHLFWSAKVSPQVAALGHGILERDEHSRYILSQLLPPICFPDADEFTQAELPKVCYDQTHERYYIMISTTNRVDERQADADVHKCTRLYHCASVDQPCEAYTKQGSIVHTPYPHLFGATILDADFENRQLLCMASYTDAAPADSALSFAPAFLVSI